MRNTADVPDGKPAFWSQSISGVSAINDAFYDIHGRKGEVLLFILSRTPHETCIQYSKMVFLLFLCMQQAKRKKW
jgi:hypothetical protein